MNKPAPLARTTPKVRRVAVTTGLVLLAVLTLSGCERRMDTPSVTYYMQHPKEREATQLSCVKEPEKKRSAQDCANAAEAEDEVLAQYMPRTDE